MNYTKGIALALTAALLSAGPAWAASDDGQTVHRTGTFLGAKFRVPLGATSGSASRPHLGLGISRFHAAIGASGHKQYRDVPGIELRLAGTGKPTLMLGGQSSATMKQRFGLAPLAVVALGGLAAAAVVVSSMSDKEKEEAELKKPQCLLPEKELCS